MLKSQFVCPDGEGYNKKGANRSRRRSVKDFVEILVVNPGTQILGCCHLHIDIRACGPILYEGNTAHILGVEMTRTVRVSLIRKKIH